MAEVTAILAAGPSRPAAAPARGAAARQDFARVLAKARKSQADQPDAESQRVRRPPAQAESTNSEEPAPQSLAQGEPSQDGATAAGAEGQSGGGSAPESAAEATETAEGSPAQPGAEEDDQAEAVPVDPAKAETGVQAGAAWPLAGIAGAATDGAAPRHSTVEEQAIAALPAPAKGVGADGPRAPREPAPAGQAQAPAASEGSGATPTGLLPEQLLPQEKAAAPRNSFELLTFDELMDPKLTVETAPQNLLDRLQQTTGLEYPMLDRLAETTLPQVVRGLVTVVREGLAEMRLQLEPPDLGQIEVRVKTVEGAVRGEVLVQHPQVKQLLDSQLERLRSGLADQGLALQGFDVGVARDGRFGHQEQAWQRQQYAGGGAWRPAGAQEAAEPQPGWIPVATGEHEVDYLA